MKKHLSKDKKTTYRVIKRESFDINTTNDMLHLMDIYLCEWKHRDSMLWKQTFTFFVAALVVMILPFSSLWGIKISDSIPKWVFPTIGMFLSVVFFVIGKGYSLRLTAIGESYNNLLKKLPEDYQRISIKGTKTNSIFSKNYSRLIVNLMFIALVVLGILFLYISLLQGQVQP